MFIYTLRFIYGDVSNNMKKRNKIITVVILLLGYFVSVYYVLPKISEYYLESDISEFENSTLILIISIALSIILTLLLVLDTSQFKLSIWKKINHVFLLSFMGYSIFSMGKYSLPAVGLLINKLSHSETFSKNFIISHKDIRKGDGQYVFGNYLEEVNKVKKDRLFVGKEQYSKLKAGLVLNLSLKKGILSIPFEPLIVE